jgi:hypothetical protein
MLLFRFPSIASLSLDSRAIERIRVVRSLLLLLVILTTAAGSLAQPKQLADASCRGIDLEAARYVVRSSRIQDPFGFLPWVRARERRAASRIATLVNGKPFQYSTGRDEALKIIEEENFLPDTSEARVKIRVELVKAGNCADLQVDLIYGVYSTQIMPVLSAPPEARLNERQAPQDAAGLSNVNVPESHPVSLKPIAGYDSADKFSAGGRLEIHRRSSEGSFINSGFIQGQASSEMHSLDAALSGFRDGKNWLAHLEWQLRYNYYSLPTGDGKIKGGSLEARLSGLTRQFGNGNLTFRFGGLLQGGNRQTDIANLRLTPDTVANSAFGSLKLYAGVASRLQHNSFSASYGLQLGAAGHGLHVDWTKHIVDVRDELWYSLGDHRTFDLETAFGFGSIHVPGKIPLGERFFGGNHEELFISEDAWQMRSSPWIRAIPGKLLSHTATGDGGDRFTSFNLTAAYAIWRKPLVPSELSHDQEFNDLLEGQLTQATESEKLYFLTKDQHYLNLVAFMSKPAGSPQLQSVLSNLKNAVLAAQTSHPGQFQSDFQTCSDAIDSAASTADDAAQQKPDMQYGYIVELISADGDDEDELGATNDACLKKLNGPAALNGDLGIAAAGQQFEQTRISMESEFRKIDQDAAGNKAKEDMAFTRRTVNTLMRDLNIYSISPVFVFDVARLGPANSLLGGMRYGPGAGVRFEIATTFHLTAGYARNVRPGPGEGKGTMFFSIGLRDLVR